MDEQQKATLKGLYLRRSVCLAALHVVAEAAAEDDPRVPVAEQNYRAQLANIDHKIEEITGRPPDIVIGLKTAVLKLKANKE